MLYLIKPFNPLKYASLSFSLAFSSFLFLLPSDFEPFPLIKSIKYHEKVLHIPYYVQLTLILSFTSIPPLALLSTFYSYHQRSILVQGIALSKGEDGSARVQLQAERRARPQKEQALNCPRCNSSNTKFCYYNNYSLSQPRYFCKGCRRYWTHGGSLRNVPIGGGLRKSKRSSSSSSSSSSTVATPITQTSLPSSSSFPIPRDLNLSFPTTSSLSALELLRSGISSRGLCPITTGAILGAGFDFQETMRPFNPKLPLEGVCAGGHGGVMQEERTGGLHFPFEQMKQVPLSNASHGAQGEGDATFFWNGVVCNGGSGEGGERLW